MLGGLRVEVGLGAEDRAIQGGGGSSEPEPPFQPSLLQPCPPTQCLAENHGHLLLWGPNMPLLHPLVRGGSQSQP